MKKHPSPWRHPAPQKTVGTPIKGDGKKAPYDYGGTFLYFYHPDHLGSTAHVTDADGELYEHIPYFPFGESWVEEAANTIQRVPYRYTSKELDEETGLYYYGARYYDPRTSVWQSADPILAKYLPTGNKDRDAKLPGMGGVFNPMNFGMYSYAHLNPVILTDPDGREVYMMFSKRTETLYAIDLDHVDTSKGFTYSSPSEYQGRQNEFLVIENVFTGENRYPGSENGSNNVPIPNGKYEILDNHLSPSHPDWYRLDSVDSTLRDDFGDDGRGNYRLHVGGNSWGCVTICSVDSEYAATEAWNKLDEMLQNTSTTTVPRQTKQKSFFGWFTDVNEDPLTKFGVMQVVE